jgi:hypothetical protein
MTTTPTAIERAREAGATAPARCRCDRPWANAGTCAKCGRPLKQPLKTTTRRAATEAAGGEAGAA